MEHFGKIIIVFHYICKKTILNLWEGSEYVLGLNMSEYLIFVNFSKYDRVLDMHRDAIMEELSIIQDFQYASFLNMYVLHKVLNMSEDSWMMPCGRVLNMPGQSFTGF